MQYTLERLIKGWSLAVILDPETAEKLLINGNKRVVATVVETGEKFHCGIAYRKALGHYVFVNGNICKKMGVKEGGTIELTFVIDESEYQFEMPEEFVEVLAQDPEAFKIFHALTPGKKRSLMYLVGQVKSTDKKIERALKIVEKIKMGITSAMEVLKK